MQRRMLWPVLLAIVVLVLLFAGLQQRTLADPGDVLVNRMTGVDQPNCGDSINPPCYSIRYALQNVAVAGDRVYVAAGTYTETFTMRPGVDVVSQSGPLLTIIDGDYARGPMVTASSPTITPAVKLEGFTITGGYASWLGGGFFIGGGASMIISNSHLISNTADVGGGGISLTGGASLLIYNSVLEDHSRTALRMDAASATILHSTFKDNVCPYEGAWGGGISGQSGCKLIISDTLFYGNQAEHGSSFIVADTELILYDSKFYSNTGGGATIHVRGPSSTFDIFNNIVEYNELRGASGIGIIDGAGSTGSKSILSNTIQHNLATVDMGGGIAVFDASAVISGNLIAYNKAENQTAGGILVRGVSSDVDIINNKIEHNNANSGGGISISYSQVNVISNTLLYNESDSGDGAAIRVDSTATVVITGNHILSNTNLGGPVGGIALIDISYAEVLGNIIAYNSGRYATALRLRNGSGKVMDNIIQHNKEFDAPPEGSTFMLEGSGAVEVTGNWISDNQSGGVIINGSTTTMTNNIIAHNTGAYPQIGISQVATPSLVNNTIVGNGVTNGIDIKQNSAPALTNNIIAGNAVGIWGDGTSVPWLDHNLVWDNSEENYWNVVQGNEDIVCDPDFIDVENGDYHLGICSCAVDAGTDLYAPPDDYDGNARPFDGDAFGPAVADIGAFERLVATAPLPVADFTYSNDMLTAVFTNTSSYAMTYQWDFGDATGVSTATNPTYAYAVPGTYPVQLTATCAFGCTDVVQQDVTVDAIFLFLPMVVRGTP